LEVATAHIAPAAHSSNPFQNDGVREKILTYLENEGTVGKEMVNAREIARALGFAHRREINPFLYQLQRKGLVIKASDSPPLWKLNKDEYFQLKLQLPKKPMASSANNFSEINDVTSTMQDFQLNSIPGTNSSSSLCPQDFLYMTKNPITTFLEYAQCNHIDGQITVISNSGPAHDPSFQAKAILGQQCFPPATGKNKKQAKTLAAEVALKMLAVQGFITNTDHKVKVIGQYQEED